MGLALGPYTCSWFSRCTDQTCFRSMISMFVKVFSYSTISRNCLALRRWINCVTSGGLTAPSRRGICGGSLKRKELLQVRLLSRPELVCSINNSSSSNSSSNSNRRRNSSTISSIRWLIQLIAFSILGMTTFAMILDFSCISSRKGRIFVILARSVVTGLWKLELVGLIATKFSFLVQVYLNLIDDHGWVFGTVMEWVWHWLFGVLEVF